MRVWELIRLLKNAPVDAPVMVSAYDHGYRGTEARITTALYHQVGGWTEDHGEKLTPEAKWGKRRDVVVIE